MSFVLDKEQVKPGLIIFRHGDVGHDNYYCRVRIRNEDRYKTISLRTADRHTARVFGTGAGLRLQRKDSDLALAIVTALREDGVSALPSYDLFIVKSRFADRLFH